jgi:hypothetical protein
MNKLFIEYVNHGFTKHFETNAETTFIKWYSKAVEAKNTALQNRVIEDFSVREEISKESAKKFLDRIYTARAELKTEQQTK